MNRTDVQTLLTGAADEPSRRVVARLALENDCIPNVYALVAAVFKKAMKDAKSGDAGATEFLDITTPDWRELSAHHLAERTEPARPHATHQNDV